MKDTILIFSFSYLQFDQKAASSAETQFYITFGIHVAEAAPVPKLCGGEPYQTLPLRDM